MTQQLDMMPGELVDQAVLERIDAQLPKTREVKEPRLRDVIDVPCEKNIPTLQWTRISDMRKQSGCGRYIVDRAPDHSKHPAMTYEYVAKRLHTSAAVEYLGTFEAFELAAAACERNLSAQPQLKG